MRLIPHDKAFFDLFNELSSKMKVAADLLVQLFDDLGRLDHFVAAMKVVEHEADQITYDVSKRLDTSFVTPLDREDIHDLAQELDNIVDLIDGTARRAEIFKIREARPRASEMVALLKKSVDALDGAVIAIKNPRTVATHTREVKRLEEEGDAEYHDALRELFSDNGRPDPIEIIKWKDLYDNIEHALDRCLDAAMVLQSISLKNS